MSLFSELKRRRVFHVVAFYAVAAWAVLQVMDLAFESWGIPERAVRHVWVGALTGLPLALVLGWRYDISWHGVVRTSVASHDASTSISLHRGDYFLLSVVAVLAAVIIGNVITRVHQTPPVHESASTPAPEIIDVPDKSLAVLPFVNMSEDTGNDYFSDSLSEELLNRLNRVAELRVSARTSSFSYRNKGLDITEIASQLGVKYILEGSVRRAGDRIRVTASLINARSGFELWSKPFEFQLEDIFAVQDEISIAVVSALKVSLLGTGNDQAMTENMDAYQLFLEGRFELNRRTAESIRRSISLLEQAIGLEPNFAAAHMELATATIVLPGFASADRATATVKARALARRAHSLDPTLGKALATLALISLHDGDWKSARSGFEDALDISGHESIIHLWYGTLLASTGHTRRALISVQRAHDLDPRSGLVSGWLCSLNLVLDDSAEASKSCSNALSLRFAYANFLQAKLLLEEENYDQAESALRAFSREFELDDRWVSPFVAAIQDKSTLSAGIEAVDLHESQMGARWDIVLMYMLLDAQDRAFAVADKAGYGENTINFVWLPQMQPFRQDPRFEALMDDMGLMDYWRQYGWPDRCHLVDEIFVCK